LKVVIVSDSHDNLLNVSKFIAYVANIGVDLIIHLGDYISPFTLKMFSSLNARLLGVFGNNDGDKLLLLKSLGSVGEIYEAPLETSIDGFKTLLLHGFGSRELTEKIVRYLANSSGYDLILYGHTHTYNVEKYGNTVMVNPGALSGYLTEYPTIAIFDTKDLSISIVDIDSHKVIKNIVLK